MESNQKSILMKASLKRELQEILRYVETETFTDLSSGKKTREEDHVLAIYLFCLLAEDYTSATIYEMGEILQRDGRSLYSSFRKPYNKLRAKDRYRKQYEQFNPFSLKVAKLDNPLTHTVEALYEIKLEFEANLSEMEGEAEILEKALAAVSDEKIFKILDMLIDLEDETLDIILERLPPIIKMA